jgi:acetyl esterase/lipase
LTVEHGVWALRDTPPVVNPIEGRRLDPRLAAVLALMPVTASPDVSSREALLAEVNQPDARAAYEATIEAMNLLDDENVVPHTGLVTAEHEFTSAPDGNTVKVLVTRPEGHDARPGVVYFHGGGMQTMSCFHGMYRAWARTVAAHGLTVVMVGFRNALLPSSAPEVEPYPAGLHDCVSGVEWAHAHAAELGLDPSAIVLAGESGGGNLTLATGMKLLRDGGIGLVRGLYAWCPYIAGLYPDPRYPSTVENDGILLSLHNNRGVMAYGIEAYERRDPLAWPAFATEHDVRGLPPTVISVNECDPLRDEGIEFYRLLLRAGVQARGRVVLGTPHGAELIGLATPDISRDAAAALAHFAREVTTDPARDAGPAAARNRPQVGQTTTEA